MGKIFKAPDQIEKPTFDFRDMVGSRTSELHYVHQVKEWCKANSKDKTNAEYIGEGFRIPMGDGYAQYVVLSIKPLQMIHLEIGDAWDSPLADQVNAAYVKQHIDGAKNWEAFRAEHATKK